jgi:transcriptional regulator with XRE-family HTH domain
LPFVRIQLVAPRSSPYPEHPKTLGEHIKKRRVECGLTQRQTATQLGVNASTILNWETGRYEPPVRSMPTIFRFLGKYPFAEPQSIGERLLQKRRERGWPIREAARNLGVDPALGETGKRAASSFFASIAPKWQSTSASTRRYLPTKCGFAGMESIGSERAWDRSEDQLGQSPLA